MILDEVEKPWGKYVTLYEDDSYWTKLITVFPGGQLSLQVHESRDEFWISLQDGLEAVIGDTSLVLTARVRYSVPRNTVHQIVNPTMNVCKLIEVATGIPDENDIVRISDIYGR